MSSRNTGDTDLISCWSLCSSLSTHIIWVCILKEYELIQRYFENANVAANNILSNGCSFLLRLKHDCANIWYRWQGIVCFWCLITVLVTLFSLYLLLLRCTSYLHRSCVTFTRTGLHWWEMSLQVYDPRINVWIIDPRLWRLIQNPNISLNY